MPDLRQANLRDTGARYELDEEGFTVWADYHRIADRIVIDHVEAPAPLRGKGSAGRLMAAISNDARARSLKITPICSYAALWLKRSAQFRVLVS